MKSIYDLLVSHPFFKDTPKPYIETIAGCGKNIHLNSGAFLAREGEEANNFYVIRQGVISIDVHTPHGGAHTIQTLSLGDIVGWSWIFPPYLWNFDLKVVKPLSAIALDGKCLREKCEKDHSLGFHLMKQFAKIMTERVRASRMQLLDVYGSPNL